MKEHHHENDLLIISLRQLDSGDVSGKGQLSAAELGLEAPGIAADTSFELSYLAYSIGEEKIVQGKLSAKPNVPCDRCLDPFVLPIAVEFRHCYVAGQGNDPWDAPASGDYYFDPEQDEFSIAEALREEVLLVLPYKLVPPETADGHCSLCGREATVEYGDPEPQAEADPRFAVLKKLLDKS